MAEVARRLGKPLMPHQRNIVDVGLEIDPATGYLAYSRVIVVGPRQATGKTELILPVLTHRCVAFDETLTDWVAQHLGKRLPPPGPQVALYSAQTADKARQRWRDVHVARLKASSFYRPVRQFEPRFQRNMEAIIWANGSMWSPESTTAQTSGTGDTTDLAVIDEAWAQRDDSVELGLRPTQLTRLWSQLWVMSMVPGPSRREPGGWPYLFDQIQVGRACVEADTRSGIAYFEFSAPDDADPLSSRTWYCAMPGLGRTVPEQRVREDFDVAQLKGTLVDLKAEYLGIVPKVERRRWAVISEETWGVACLDAGSVIVGVKALGVEITEDRGRAVIGVAGRRADGHWHVEVVEPGARVPAGTRGVSWVLPRVLELVDEHEVCAVVVDPRRPANSLVERLRAAGVNVLTPNQGEVAAACARFYDATGQEPPSEGWDGVRLFHLGQPELESAVAVAQRYDLPGGSFVFVRRGSAQELSDLYSVVLGMHGFDVASGESYDLAESVDSSCPCVCGRYVYPADVGGQWRHADDDSHACLGFVSPWGGGLT